MREVLSLEELRKILSYNPETGNFTWIFRANRNIKVGAIAGSDEGRGYIIITINRVRYYAHRLAWLFKTGEWPSKHIDHINGTPSDNSFVNLREATNEENGRNSRMRKNNTSGAKGVSWNAPKRKYKTAITVNYKTIYVGYFPTREEAAAAYEAAARKYHGEFARTE